MRTPIKLHTLTAPPALPTHEQAARGSRATLLHFPAPPRPSVPPPLPSPETRKTLDLRRESARAALQPPFTHSS